MKTTFKKITRVGRTTALCIALAVVLATTVGVVSPATAQKAKDAVFELGKKNPVETVSTMVGTLAKPILRLDNNGSGPALDLRVESGKAPLTVNPEAGTATNLGADKVDGKSAGEIGVNGLEQVTRSTGQGSNSQSPKFVEASCPAGKVLIGTGYDIVGGKDNVTNDTDVVIDDVSPDSTTVHVEAYEEEPTDLKWDLTATAICATAP